MSKKGGECVQVCVRCRPMNDKEKQDKRVRIVEMEKKTARVGIRNPSREGEEPKWFTFDNVFTWESTQQEVYNETAIRVVNSVLEGYNGTIFAYGQTGTGKTWTMAGYGHTIELRGIIPNTFFHIFEHIDETKDKEFLVRASFLEIYNEEIRDLLGKDSKKKLDLRENQDTGVYVKDLSSFVVKGVDECEKVMELGEKNRSVGATKMNERSSRSHSIFTITVETSELGPDGENHIRVGKLNLVDLAGSERQSKTGATGDRLKEANKINLSLSALGNVIAALVDAKSSHVPYRDSKLTRLLQDSLGGNTKTLMLAMLGPADYNYDETITTLRYANRAKNIKNKPKINEDPKDAMLREFQEEIERLKKLLADGGVDPSAMPAAMGGALGQPQVIREVVNGETIVKVEGVAPELMAELEAKSKAEVDAILNEKNLAQEEKDRIAAELDSQRGRLDRERHQRAKLAKKLKAMQEKLIVGGVSIVDVAAQQERELKKKEAELAERARQERVLEAQLEAQQEERLNLEEQYSSMAEEVEIKTKKLKKLWGHYQTAKGEIDDLQQEFQREREDLLDSIRELTKQLKLKMMIIDHFIPPEEVTKIENRADWDEEADNWRLAKLQLAGNNTRSKRPPSASGARRPLSEIARMANAMGDQNPRYKGDNILNLELDMPERTTTDYDPNNPDYAGVGLSNPYDDNGWVMGGENLGNVYFSYDGGAGGASGGGSSNGGSKRSGRPPVAKRPGSARGKARSSSAADTGAGDGGEQYPTARGLVSNKKHYM